MNVNCDIVTRLRFELNIDTNKQLPGSKIRMKYLNRPAEGNEEAKSKCKQHITLKSYIPGKWSESIVVYSSFYCAFKCTINKTTYK